MNKQTFLFNFLVLIRWSSAIRFAFRFISGVNRSHELYKDTGYCATCHIQQILSILWSVDVKNWASDLQVSAEAAWCRAVRPARSDTWRYLAMGLTPRRSARLYGTRPHAAASASSYPAHSHPPSVSAAPAQPPEHTITLMSFKAISFVYICCSDAGGRVVPHYRKLRPDEEEWAIYYLWHSLSPLRERERERERETREKRRERRERERGGGERMCGEWITPLSHSWSRIRGASHKPFK